MDSVINKGDNLPIVDLMEDITDENETHPIEINDSGESYQLMKMLPKAT